MGATYRQKAKGNGHPWFIFVSHGGKRNLKRKEANHGNLRAMSNMPHEAGHKK